MENEENKKYKQAKAEVKELKDYYSHLFAYVGVIIMLLVIDLVSGPGLWFYWVAIFWGIGIFWHTISVFLFKKAIGSSWEEKKIKEIMDNNK